MAITNITKDGAFTKDIASQINSNFSQTLALASSGVLLNLGTLSAAGTTSAMDASGIVTVTGANTLTAGQFIVMSNGASAVGICMNGQMVMVTSANTTSYTYNFGQGKALTYVSATDTLKYQVVQANASNLLQAKAGASPVTGVLATAVLLTVTQQNSFVAGQFVVLNGTFKAASLYASGAIVQIASATATGWTANWQGTIIAQTSAESGAYASLLITNGGVPIASFPQSTGPISTLTNVLTVASDATHAGLFTLTGAQAFQPGMLIVVQGVGTSTELNGSIATVITTSLTQAIIKANGWTVLRNTQAETAGYACVLVTGDASSVAIS